MYKSKPTFFTDYKKIRQRVNDVGLFVAKITNVKGSGAVKGSALKNPPKALPLESASL